MSAPVPPRRLLVIEDDADVRAFLALALALDGHEVTLIDRGPVPEPPAAGAWHLALVDLWLAGVEATPLVAELARRGVPVLLTTGLGPEAPAVGRARRSGARGTLCKPFDLDDLRQAVRQWALPGG